MYGINMNNYLNSVCNNFLARNSARVKKNALQFQNQKMKRAI